MKTLMAAVPMLQVEAAACAEELQADLAAAKEGEALELVVENRYGAANFSYY